MINLKSITMCSLIALAVTFGTQGFSQAADQTTAPAKKYAVVDVKKVVNSAKSVKELKEERKSQKEAVANFIKDGNALVAAEKDKAKKDELKKKLNNDLKYMTKTYDKKYKEGLVQVNKEILSEIAEMGKAGNYDLILTTDAVLYGGENITKDLVKKVK